MPLGPRMQFRMNFSSGLFSEKHSCLHNKYYTETPIKQQVSFRAKTDDIFTREKDHHCYCYIITVVFCSETEMIWEFIGVYKIKRTLHGHLENYSSRVEKYFTRSLRSLVDREIFFNTRRQTSCLRAALAITGFCVQGNYSLVIILEFKQRKSLSC